MLRQILEGRQEKEVFLEADRAVPYGEVVKVMAAIREAGVQKLGMVAEQPEVAPFPVPGPAANPPMKRQHPDRQQAGYHHDPRFGRLVLASLGVHLTVVLLFSGVLLPRASSATSGRSTMSTW